MADQWHHVNSLFLRALDLDPGERAAFLVQGCAGDEALRRDVESLLASHEQASRFLEQPLLEAAALVAERRDQETESGVPADDLAGRLVAGYRIDARLGAGGMGEVYKAHDLKLDRPVALQIAATPYHRRRGTAAAFAVGGAGRLVTQSSPHRRCPRFR